MATTTLRPSGDAGGRRKHAVEHERRIARTAFFYILPSALIMLLITFWPLIYQFWMSFTNYSNRNLRTDNLLLQVWGSFTGNLAAHNSPQLVALGNYFEIVGGDLAKILSGFDFWRILLFNVVWTATNLIFHVGIGVAVAVLLNQNGMKFKRFYRSIYIIPWALPSLVASMIWKNMWDDVSGGVNQIIRLLGGAGKLRWLLQIDPPVNWLPPYVRAPDWANPYLLLLILLLLILVPYLFRWVRRRWLPFTIVWIAALELFCLFGLTPLLNLLRGLPAGAAATLLPMGKIFPLSFYAVLAANIWLGWPFMMTVATGALQSIPRELYEAAEVDGATGWQAFWGVTVPLLRPAMIPAIIVGITMTFNQFNVIYFISGGGPLHSTEILVTQAYRLVNETTVNLAGIGNVRPYGMAASFAYIVFLILASITLVTNRISRATEAYNE